MNLIITEAIVVRVVDYGEADRVATMITRSSGKVSALARGARRSRKRFSALELFSRGEAQLKEGRGDLWTLQGFDVTRGFPHLTLDVARVAQGAYVCELVRELLPWHEPEARAWGLLVAVLTLLDEATARPAHLRIFELALLDTLGLAPSLDRCVACGRTLEDPGDTGSSAPAADEGAQLDLRRGGVVCGECAASHAPGSRPLPPRVRRLLVDAQRTPLGEAIRLIDALDDKRIWDGARDALQAVLLGHLGRPLRTVEFIAKLNAH